MSDRLVTVARCGTEWEAEQYRSVLAGEGIAAFVEGGQLKSTLFHIGTAIGSVRVVTRESDAARATKILESLEQTDHEAGDWYCGECREMNEEAFDICWSCQRPRAECEAPLPDASTESPNADMADEADEEFPADMSPENDASVDAAERRARRANPYVSPRTIASKFEPPTPPPDPEIEAELLRAFRAAIFGCFVLPVILNFYSMYLLVRASRGGQPFSDKGNSRFYLAWSINLMSTIVWTTVFFSW
jgi:hypothetical protein